VIEVDIDGLGDIAMDEGGAREGRPVQAERRRL
jgi:hypothetical protein